MADFDILVIRGEDAAGFREWNALVDTSPVPDVYYRPGYAALYRGVEEKTVALLMSRNGVPRLLLPLILRPIVGAPNRIDAVTPYGYGGVCPLVNDFPGPSELSAMLEALTRWGAVSGIVCFVLRLHPLLRQEQWRKELEANDRLHFRHPSPTVAIDLSCWDADCNRPTGMNTMRRRNMAVADQSLRSTLTEPFAGQEHVVHLKAFSSLYNDAMVRLNADPFLRFPPSYFTSLSELLPGQAAVQLCWAGDEPVAGAIFFADILFGHYHLGAVTELGRKFSAGTMSIVEGARWAYKRRCRWLHLGGGNKVGDSLFEFKRSFGGKLFEYLPLTLVVDPAEFSRLGSLPETGWPYR